MIQQLTANQQKSNIDSGIKKTKLNVDEVWFDLISRIRMRITHQSIIQLNSIHQSAMKSIRLQQINAFAGFSFICGIDWISFAEFISFIIYLFAIQSFAHWLIAHSSNFILISVWYSLILLSRHSEIESIFIIHSD